MTATSASARCTSHAPLTATLLLASLFAACQSGPYEAGLMVKSTEQLNLTFDKQASSVNIRVFQLKDTGPFLNKSVEDLFVENPDLPAMTWVQPPIDGNVYINKCATIPLEIKPKVRYLGVVGYFNQDESDGQHRVIVPVDEIDSVTLCFDQYSIVVRSREELEQASEEEVRSVGQPADNGASRPNSSEDAQ